MTRGLESLSFKLSSTVPVSSSSLLTLNLEPGKHFTKGLCGFSLRKILRKVPRSIFLLVPVRIEWYWLPSTGFVLFLIVFTFTKKFKKKPFVFQMVMPPRVCSLFSGSTAIKNIFHFGDVNVYNRFKAVVGPHQNFDN